MMVHGASVDGEEIINSVLVESVTADECCLYTVDAVLPVALGTFRW